MAMANMNLIGVSVPTLWPVQALACGGGGGGDGGGGDGGATKNIISPKFSNFGDIIINIHILYKITILQIIFYIPHHINICDTEMSNCVQCRHGEHRIS